MIHVFEGPSADVVWNQAFHRLRSPFADEEASRAGEVSELLRAVLHIENPRRRWVVGRVPAMNPAFAIAEVLWLLRGRSDANFLLHWNRSLRKFVGNSTELHGAYGRRLRFHLGFDQLERAAKALVEKPETRQVVLQIWDGRIDLPDEDGTPASQDVPCNLSSMLKVRGDRLEWTQTMRSNDLFRGLPYNIVQFTFLQEVLAGWIGIEVGSYAQWSDSLHLYRKDAHLVDHVDIDDEGQTDDLRLPYLESTKVWKEMEDFCGILPQLKSEADLLISVERVSMPRGYVDLALVLCAEEARRRGWIDAVPATIAKCGNASLRTMFNRWCDERPSRSGNAL